MTTVAFHDDAIKVATKALNKADDGTLKMKKLVKKIVKMDGKQVSLTLQNKKRNTAESNNDGSEEPLPKKSKKTTPTVLADADVAQWRKDNKIVLKDTVDDEEGAKKSEEINNMKEYHPYSTFDAPGCIQHIPASLLKQCTEINKFKVPSPIQAQCWPVLLEPVGPTSMTRDVVGIAETGSGKTLAFAMPALANFYKQDQKNKNNNKKRTPRMLVVAPTRELAMQSHDVLQEFGSVVNLKSLVVYGGVPKHTQAAALKKGDVDIVVATPGRLTDLMNDGGIDLSQVSYLVLDEADRMLDEGFRDEIIYIISQCASHENGRQTLMFSATWPAAIQKIALEFMRDPIRVYVGFEAIVGSNGGAMDDSLSANKRVTQTVEVIEDRARDARLRKLLEKHHKKRDNRILIFALYKKEAERLEFSLKRDGWKCCSIHGNKSQPARTEALASFKDGSCPLMIATDVAARGLDIPNVEMVINFTFPLTIEDYVHRIGRTGRAGKTGISYTFFQPGDKSHAGELQQIMKQAGQEIPQELLNFGSTIKKKEHKLYGNFGPSAGPMKKATKIVFD
ncbi:DEAD box helicase-like protein [Fragilaria crotonensis]|nr:DEAD box helicase-like protein [Fragilaria crotonensis]